MCVIVTVRFVDTNKVNKRTSNCEIEHERDQNADNDMKEDWNDLHPHQFNVQINTEQRDSTHSRTESRSIVPRETHLTVGEPEPRAKILQETLIHRSNILCGACSRRRYKSNRIELNGW